MRVVNFGKDCRWGIAMGVSPKAMVGNKFAVVHIFTHWLVSHLQGASCLSPRSLQAQPSAWPGIAVICESCCIGHEHDGSAAASAA